MKNFKNPSKRWLAGIGVLGLLSVSLSSCLKNNNNYYNPPVAYVAVIQASPDEPPLNLFLNNNQVNFGALNFDDNFGYFKAFTGLRTVNFDNAYTMAQVLSDTVQLNQNQSYTMFLVNTAAHPQLLLLTDTLNQPGAGNASIRFVNVAPDAPAVDLAIHGGAKLASNKSFKGHSAFVPVTGNTNVTLDVLKAGTTTVLASLPNTTLNGGSVYTVWFHGLTNTTVTGEKLGVSIVANTGY